jgi:hypothetical protein
MFVKITPVQLFTLQMKALCEERMRRRDSALARKREGEREGGRGGRERERQR